jgi:hypothetical protein
MPEAGLTVWGILTADGLPDSKIRFVPAEQVDQIQPNRCQRYKTLFSVSIKKARVHWRSLYVKT